MDAASLRAVLNLYQRHTPRSLSLLRTLLAFCLLSPQSSGSLNSTMPGNMIILRNSIFVDIIKLRCNHTGVQQALDPVRLVGVPIRKGKGNTEENVTKTNLNTRSKVCGKAGGRGYRRATGPVSSHQHRSKGRFSSIAFSGNCPTDTVRLQASTTRRQCLLVMIAG